MIHIIKKKIIMTEELKSKITWACSFNNTEPKIIEGNLRIVECTNLAYVEPHRVIIKDKLLNLDIFQASVHLVINEIVQRKWL